MNRRFSANKKLNFNISDDDEDDIGHSYKKQRVLVSSDSDTDSVDSAFESPEEDFLSSHLFNDISPVRPSVQRVTYRNFLRRRPRTSTKETDTNSKESQTSSKRRHSSTYSSTDSSCDSDDSGRYSPIEDRSEDEVAPTSRYENEFTDLEEIASGAFGAVRLAKHKLDGNIYAVKFNKR